MKTFYKKKKSEHKTILITNPNRMKHTAKTPPQLINNNNQSFRISKR